MADDKASPITPYCGGGSVFHFGFEDAVLFDFWTVKTALATVISIIIIAFFSAFYEFFKYFREKLGSKRAAPPAGGCPSQAAAAAAANPNAGATMWSSNHMIQCVLHFIQVILSNLLMLIFMTYNIPLCLALAVGSTIGFFLIGWKKGTVVDRNEQCH